MDIAISFGSYTPKEMHQIVSNPKMHLKLIFIHAYERMQDSGQLNLDLFVDMHIKTKNIDTSFEMGQNNIPYKIIVHLIL